MFSFEDRYFLVLAIIPAAFISRYIIIGFEWLNDIFKIEVNISAIALFVVLSNWLWHLAVSESIKSYQNLKKES